MRYNVGEILVIKEDSVLFELLPWPSFKYPQCKIYWSINGQEGNLPKDRYYNVYFIGPLDGFLHEYWGNIAFSEDEMYHFIKLKELRKQKIIKINGKE